jgi:hypothetical protein
MLRLLTSMLLRTLRRVSGCPFSINATLTSYVVVWEVWSHDAAAYLKSLMPLCLTACTLSEQVIAYKWDVYPPYACLHIVVYYYCSIYIIYAFNVFYCRNICWTFISTQQIFVSIVQQENKENSPKKLLRIWR